MIDKWYHILGLKPGATEAQVRKAYRILAKKYHPDIDPSPEAYMKFLELSEAYEKIMSLKFPGSYHRTVKMPPEYKFTHPDPKYSPKPPGQSPMEETKRRPFFYTAEFLIALSIFIILMVQDPIRHAIRNHNLQRYGDKAWGELLTCNATLDHTLGAMASIPIGSYNINRYYSFRCKNVRSHATSPVGLPLSRNDVYLTYYFPDKENAVYVDFSQPDSATIQRIKEEVVFHIYGILHEAKPKAYMLAQCDFIIEAVYQKDGLEGLAEIWRIGDGSKLLRKLEQGYPETILPSEGGGLFSNPNIP